MRDMQDGVECFHLELAPKPKGFPHNHLPPPQEAEIEARKIIG
jgi:hypothetical protein